MFKGTKVQFKLQNNIIQKQREVKWLGMQLYQIWDIFNGWTLTNDLSRLVSWYWNYHNFKRKKI